MNATAPAGRRAVLTMGIGPVPALVGCLAMRELVPAG
jgi:hypothetical protein